MAHRSRKYDSKDIQVRRRTSVPRLLGDCTNLCKDLLLEKLANRGHHQVGLSHSVVLRHMDFEGTAQSLIARRAGVSRQAIAKVVGQLARLGYIRTVRDPHDRRAKILELTANGVRLFEDSIEIYDEIERTLSKKIGRQRLVALRSTLQAIIDGQVL